MDFIRECIEQHSSVLIDQLEVVGFSEEQARNFIPVAISGILESTRDFGLEQTIIDLDQQPAMLLNSINSYFISQQIGVTPIEMDNGIKAIAPVFLQGFSKSQTGIVNTIFSLVTPPASLLIKSTRKFLN